MKKILLISAVLLLTAACSRKPAFDLDKNIGVCRQPDKAQAMIPAGCSHLEIGISSFLMPEAPDTNFARNRKLARECGLPIYSGNGFFPKDIALTGPERDMERIRKYTETAMARGSELGMKIFVLGSGKARNIPEGVNPAKAREDFKEVCSMIADLGAKYGIVVVIEPLRKQETNFINTVRECNELVKEINKPYLKVHADFFHMMTENEGPGALIEAGDNLAHCHIAEADRKFPGCNGDDFTHFFEALKEIGYTGKISIEAGWNKFDEDIFTSVEFVKNQINDIKTNK